MRNVCSNNVWLSGFGAKALQVAAPAASGAAADASAVLLQLSDGRSSGAFRTLAVNVWIDARSSACRTGQLGKGATHMQKIINANVRLSAFWRRRLVLRLLWRVRRTAGQPQCQNLRGRLKRKGVDKVTKTRRCEEGTPAPKPLTVMTLGPAVLSNTSCTATHSTS